MASKRKTSTRKQPTYIPENPPLPPRETPPHPRVMAARSILAAAHIEFIEGAEPAEPWRVAGRFNYWPLSARWSEDNTHPLSNLEGRHIGYGVVNLRNLIQQQATLPEALEAVGKALDPMSAPDMGAINA
jgi:hypothetical protein